MTGERPFRFFDNREKYLLFVTTCSEKWAIGQRIGAELAALEPAPPALRVFDAGTGDGTVMASVLRQLHGHFPTVPFLVVGKEISLEDVRLTLEKLPDRFSEHPQTVVALTNLNYRDAPWLQPAGDGAGHASTGASSPSRDTPRTSSTGRSRSCARSWPTGGRCARARAPATRSTSSRR